MFATRSDPNEENDLNGRMFCSFYRFTKMKLNIGFLLQNNIGKLRTNYANPSENLVNCGEFCISEAERLFR